MSTASLPHRIKAVIQSKLTKEYKYYQPEDLTPEQWKAIDDGNFDPFLKLHVQKKLDRLTFDRAIMIRNALKLQGDFRGKTLLDLGCNTGFLTHYFAREGMKATGIDSNSHNSVKATTVDAKTSVIATAKRLAKQYGVEATFMEGDIFEYLATKPSYDVVLCMSLFHHFFEVGAGYGVREKKDIDQLFRLITDSVKHIMYFEIDHLVANKHGWTEDQLPTILKEKGGFTEVRIVGISIDAWKRYRNIYECVR